MPSRSLTILGFLIALPATVSLAFGADNFVVTIKNHKFEPASVQIPAGARVKLTVTNADKTAEEFESRDLHVEKMVPGGQSVTVYVGPLKSGEYSFLGDLHQESAKGVLLAK